MPSLYGAFGLFFSKMYQSQKRFFSHTVWPKNENLHIFVEKNEMYRHDQNIGSPEKFSLSDMEHFGSLLKKMDRPR